MRSFFLCACLAIMLAQPVLAGNGDEGVIAFSDDNVCSSEFEPSGTPGGGFLTDLLNRSLERAIPDTLSSDVKPAYGRKLSNYISAPKFGGYFIGKFAYSSQDGKYGGDGFSQRFIRVYVDGTILKDFKYRMQAQISNNNVHMKDYFLEWSHWKELAVKVGQYKRAFLFENPYNPWDVGAGDYAQITRQLSGIGIVDGGVPNGGRDQGLQVQGDLFPARKDGHRFVHYQLQMMNGQGINSADKNRRKDFLGTLQVQPVKDLFIGVFGWTGDYVTGAGQELDRKRWAASVKYEHEGWTARAEYAHSKGFEPSDRDETTGTWQGTGRSDGWYATVGIPCTSWLKVYAKYDVFRRQATWGSMKSIYSVVPNFQPHKNLLFQLQYNFVNDRNLAHHNYHELWGEVYVRF